MLDAVGFSSVQTLSSRVSTKSANLDAVANLTSLTHSTNQRTENQAANFSSRVGSINDSINEAPLLEGQRNITTVSHSRSEFSAAQLLGETDMNMGVDSIGGPMDLVN